MAEVFFEYPSPVRSDSGTTYVARVCGRPSGHLWEGWIEFATVDGGKTVRSARETTQPNRQDLDYWAAGLTPVFLEGSLRRALNPFARPVAAPAPPPAYDAPAPAFRAEKRVPTAEGVLNPMSVYRKGEAHLRKQLAALSPWHLVNIVQGHQLSTVKPDNLSRMTGGELIELIVRSARERLDARSGRAR